MPNEGQAEKDFLLANLKIDVQTRTHRHVDARVDTQAQEQKNVANEKVPKEL